MIPFISIIVPVFNVEEYLAECLDSILAQSFADFELMAVNDGSTDGSGAILEDYAARDSRIRVICQDNGGLSAARNAALKEARGSYCILVDSDDVIHPQLLEVCHYFIQRYGADFIGYDHVNIEPHAGMPHDKLIPSTLSHRFSRVPLPLLAQRHRYRISLMAPHSCCRTSLSRAHLFEPGLLYEDYPRTCSLMRDVQTVVSLRTPLYGYTMRPGSIMRRPFAAACIEHYRRGLLSIANAYGDDEQRLAVISRIVFPEILKQIGNSIFRAEVNDAVRVEMLRAFRALLTELKARGLLRWRGHKLRRYLAYSKLINAKEDKLEELRSFLFKIFH